MDLKATGKFIQDCRKLKKLTQAELALKIGVSEKTISKWECGNGFPDTTLMLPLCKELNITANELLSAKFIPTEQEYKKIAEENIILLKDQKEKYAKHLLSLEWVIGSLSVAFLLIMTIIASYCPISDGWRIGIIVIGAIFCFIGVHFCLQIEQSAGFYECGLCHNKYVPTYKQVLWSAHIGRTRHMKCPKCGKKSWSKKTVIGDN